VIGWLLLAAARNQPLSCACLHHVTGTGGDDELTTFNNMVTLWGMDDCERLIEEIRKHEVIWKSDHKDNGKHGPRLVAWRKISSALEKFSTVSTVLKLSDMMVLYCFALRSVAPRVKLKL